MLRQDEIIRINKTYFIIDYETKQSTWREVSGFSAFIWITSRIWKTSVFQNWQEGWTTKTSIVWTNSIPVGIRTCVAMSCMKYYLVQAAREPSFLPTCGLPIACGKRTIGEDCKRSLKGVARRLQQLKYLTLIGGWHEPAAPRSPGLSVGSMSCFVCGWMVVIKT